jgi:hypothetical protein
MLALKYIDRVQRVWVLYPLSNGTWKYTEPWTDHCHHIRKVYLVICHGAKNRSGVRLWTQIDAPLIIDPPEIAVVADNAIRDNKDADVAKYTQYFTWWLERCTNGELDDFGRVLWEYYQYRGASEALHLSSTTNTKPPPVPPPPPAPSVDTHHREVIVIDNSPSATSDTPRRRSRRATSKEQKGGKQRTSQIPPPPPPETATVVDSATGDNNESVVGAQLLDYIDPFLQEQSRVDTNNNESNTKSGQDDVPLDLYSGDDLSSIDVQDLFDPNTFDGT